MTPDDDFTASYLRRLRLYFETAIRDGSTTDTRRMAAQLNAEFQRLQRRDRAWLRWRFFRLHAGLKIARVWKRLGIWVMS